METFGETIKRLREEQNIPLRKVAAYIDIDQAILSKIEHGSRRPKREQVIELAKYFKVDEKPLLIKWLAGKVLEEVYGDEFALDALQIASQMLKSTVEQPKEDKPSVLDYLKLGESPGMEKMFHSNKLPTYTELARYLFKTATGKKFDEDKVDIQTNFIGEDKEHELYLFYMPNQEWLKNNALTLNMIKNLPDYKGKKRLIFASLKYVDDETCVKHHIEFARIPY
ncbi:helix-turn-helix domain-containing protein [Mucilaginibacter sp.]